MAQFGCRSSFKVKIGDFGLTRMLPPGEEYWRLDKAGRLPVKYMAIETLTLKRFGVESDVWAFGYADGNWVLTLVM